MVLNKAIDLLANVVFLVGLFILVGLVGLEGIMIFSSIFPDFSWSPGLMWLQGDWNSWYWFRGAVCIVMGILATNATPIIGYIQAEFASD